MKNIDDSNSRGAGPGAALTHAERRRCGTKRGSPEWKKRLSKGQRLGWATRRRLIRMAPEWWQLVQAGVVSERMKPHVMAAMARGLDMENDLGGDLSAQQHAILRKAVHLEGVITAIAAQLALSDQLDADLCSKLGTLIGVQRSQLSALGLERKSRELDLADYLASHSAAQDRAERAGTMTANGSDPHVADAENVANAATEVADNV